ncbi:MAG: M81 family metallopeptidase [Alphaproteobacteria bacterium]
MKRSGQRNVAIIGFQHETNTFANSRADITDFEVADAWPGMCLGNEVYKAVEGKNIPVAGFVAYANLQGWKTEPIIWCSAAPSGPVTERAFEFVWDHISAGIGNCKDLDAVYIDFHGAMVACHYDDAEGEILRRLHQILTKPILIVCSLDFHANVSPSMIELADYLVPYQTYPHIDMAATGRRTGQILQEALEDASTVETYKSYARASYLIPMVWQYTGSEALKGIYEAIHASEANEGIISVSFTPGFPLADTVHTGPMIVVYGRKQTLCDEVCKRLSAVLESFRPNFTGTLYTAEQAVERAKLIAASSDGPVVLADTQDNPGCGGSSDTVGILQELILQSVPSAVVGLICAPEAAKQCHAAGEGAWVELSLGGNRSGEIAVRECFSVEKVANGVFTGTGPFYHGCAMDLGLMACVKLGGIKVVISSKRQQAADQAMFRHVGIEPENEKIISLKSSVHFRADFEPLASEIMIVASPGENIADLTTLKYKKCQLLCD